VPAPSAIGLFLLAALVLLLIPGPAVLNIITCSIAQGKRAGLVCVLGTHLASLMHITAAALGLSALLMSSALAFSAVKYLGAAYLVYLGARALLAAEGSHRAHAAPKGSAQLFAQGFWVNLLNPKTALFFFAFLPQFVDPARGAAAGQIFLFGALFVMLGLCTDSGYALLAGAVGQWWQQTNARFRQTRRYATGCVYIGLGLTAAFAGSERK